jgi:phasin family protein
MTTTTLVFDFQKGQTQALHAASQALFEATEKLAHLNLAAARALLQEWAETTQALFDAKDMQDLMAVNAEVTQPLLAKLASYGRNVYAIAGSLGSALSRIAEDRVTESQHKAEQLVDLAARNSPSGSEPAVAMIRNAMALSSSAYERLSQAAKQAVEAAESNLAAVSDSALENAEERGEGKSRSRKAA